MSTWNIGKKCKQIFSFFILVASEGLYCIIYSPYNYIVLWSTSYIQKAHHILYFSPSLLEVAALETFNGAISSSNSFFPASTRLQNISCFTRRWSFDPHSTSFESSLLCTLKSFRIESDFERARASNGRSRARLFFVVFVSIILLRASNGRPLKESWRRDSNPQTSDLMLTN